MGHFYFKILTTNTNYIWCKLRAESGNPYFAQPDISTEWSFTQLIRKYFMRDKSNNLSVKTSAGCGHYNNPYASYRIVLQGLRQLNYFLPDLT